MVSQHVGFDNQSCSDVSFDELKELEFLGEGNYAQVYSACFREKQVAVKIMRPDVDQRESQQQFETEIDLMRHIDHESIVGFYGCGWTVEDPPRRFMILELMEMGSLHDSMKSCSGGLKKNMLTKMSFHTKIEMVFAIANGLKYLSRDLFPEKVVLHRDIKPHNMALTRNGSIKILDLGLAKSVERSSNEDEVYSMTGDTGTVRYMAPEVAKGEPYNDKADVYSFSMVAWYILTGKMPYGNLTLNQMQEYVFQGFERPRCSKSWAPEISELLSKCWAQESSERPNFAEITRSLAHWLRLNSSCEATQPSKFRILKSRSSRWVVSKFKKSSSGPPTALNSPLEEVKVEKAVSLSSIQLRNGAPWHDVEESSY